MTSSIPENVAAIHGSRWDLQLGARLREFERRRGLITTAFVLALGVELLSFVLNARVSLEYHSWSRLFWPSAEPLGVIPMALAEHRHRILAPLLAHVLHLRGPSAALVPLAANIFVHAAGYVWLRRQALRPEYALAVVLLVATTLVVAANRMVLGFQDGLAALGLLLALSARRPWGAACALGVFMFADERIVTAAPLLLFWHLVGRPFKEVRRDLAVRAAAMAIAAVASLLLMQLVRMKTGVAAAAAEHMQQTLRFEMLRYNSNALFLGYFMALRGAWLIPAVAIVVLWRESRRDAVLFALCILATLPAAALVGDISRVAAFCAIPSVYIGAVLIAQNLRWNFRQTVVPALLVNLLCPCLHMVGDDFMTGYPLPVQLLRNYVQTGELQIVIHDWAVSDVDLARTH